MNQDPKQRLVEKAQAAHDAQRFDLVLHLAADVLVLDPQNVDIRCHLISALLKLRKQSEAHDCAAQWIEIAPNDWRSYYLFAHSLDAIGQSGEALTAIDNAIKLMPERSFLHSFRAYLLRQLQQLDNSLVASQLAVSLDPNSEFAWQNLGIVQLLKKEFAQAEASFRKAVELNPNCADNLNNLGVSLIRQGNALDAAAAFKAALHANPCHAISKKNTKSVLDRFLFSGSSLLIAISLLVVCLVLYLDIDLGFGRVKFNLEAQIILGVIFSGAMTIMFLAYCFRRRRMNAADPDLHRIYKTIKRDLRTNQK